MAGTIAWGVRPDGTSARGAESSVDFDGTGASIALPNDTQQVEIYCVEASLFKFEALAGTAEGWQPCPAATWAVFRELDGIGTVAVKAVSTAGKVYAQAVTPRGVKGGR